MLRKREKAGIALKKKKKNHQTEVMAYSLLRTALELGKG